MSSKALADLRSHEQRPNLKLDGYPTRALEYFNEQCRSYSVA